MKREIFKVTTLVLLALLALLVKGSDGDLAAETNTTVAKLEENSTGSKTSLLQESVGENGDDGEGRSLGLLKLKLKRTKSSYKAAKPKGQYGAPKAQHEAPKAQYGAPKAQYGAPKAQYGAPKAEYGPPKANYEAPDNSSPSDSPPVQVSSSNSHSIFSVAAYRPPSYNPPSYSPPSYNPPSYSAPSYNPPSYSAPSYNPPSYSPPSYNPPSYSPPSYNPPSYSPSSYNPPSYDPFASSFYKPQEYNTAENSGALHDSDAPYSPPANYEESAYPTPAYVESTDDQQQDYSPEHNDDSYAPVSEPEFSLPYQHGEFNYPETNEDSGEDFFTSSNDFPTFNEFLKQNPFNFPNF
ncbi:DNA-directed RNA polymerase II subunit RPB1-like isoform X2 [Daphnia carinata]|uniref:DNA-directed RNA polymerase II subunit RPB1-like isoform X2 n=1 Tax=Daphnia carinata TaxID=120202 RepID=UPI0025802B90|nr:DNA-directed RNA polymerase II subunit RPB1-like isoform X2 [Daphnia carinata]